MRKKILIITLLTLSFSIKNYSQTRTCGSVTNLPYLQQASPSDYQSIMNLESFIQNYIASVNNGSNTARLSSPNSVIIIPVVVHVLHRGEAIGVGRNITDAQIQSQISVLNEDFRRLNANSVNTPVPFQSVASDPNFEFRLACVDPNGNPTNGITRTLASKDFYPENNGVTIDEAATGIKYTAQGGKDAWPTNRYLNIWVCNITALLYGYAQRPDKYSTQPNTDGVVVHYTSFGRTGNISTGISGRVCTHEVGHWLGLLHPWGDVNCGSDFVEDTPPQESYVGGCPSIFPTYSPYCPGNNAQNTANGIMFMNFMQQTDDNCKNLFTKGQALRMRSMFATVNGISGPRKAFIDNYFYVNQPPALICTTGTITARNTNCLPITWSVSGPASIISGQNTNSITLQKTGNGIATVTANAGGYIDAKTVRVGLYSTSEYNITQYPSTVCNNGIVQVGMPWYYTPPVPNTTYNWYYGGGLTYISGQGTSVITLRYNSQGPFTTPWVMGRANNDCGQGPFKTINLSVNPNCYSSFAVSPNPSNDIINIEPANDPAVKKAQTMPREVSLVELTDKMGVVRYRQKFGKSVTRATINVSNLPSDIYTLRIFDGQIWVAHKVIIQH